MIKVTKMVFAEKMQASVSLSTWSKKKVEFLCTCGNKIITTYKIGIRRKDCGECWKANLNIGTQIRQLKLLEDIKFKNKSDLAEWECDCGIIKKIAIKSVLNGLTSSCGCKMIRSNIGSCDKRNHELINLQTLYGTKYGDLSIVDTRSIYIHKRSDEKILTSCKCGKAKLVRLGSIVRGNTKSCGECNFILYKAHHTFGHLKLIKDLYAGPHSEITVKCLCSCGNISSHLSTNLIQGKTTSCGNCGLAMLDWWRNKMPIVSNNPEKYSLPYLLDYFKGSKLLPLEGSASLNKYINFKCLYCDKQFTTKLEWVYRNKTMSCGCINHRISRLSHKIASLYPGAQLEFKIGDLSYDIRLGNYVIECHGLRYHSSQLRSSRAIDRNKRRVAIAGGYRYIMLYEDEINDNISKIKRYLDHLTGLANANIIKIRPQNIKIRQVSGTIASEFLGQHHYLGGCSCKQHFAGYFEDKIVAMMSFSHPSRQNINGIELKRFCVHADYKIYGLGSYMLKKLINNGLITLPIVSYSDNRLHEGHLYVHMGFTKVHETKQDYYWVKNNKRYHKSALRKPSGCTITESSLRESQGYHKIYDLGKTKWIKL